MFAKAGGDGDEGLMRAVRRGDVAAFGALVDRHLPAVYRLCHRLLNDGHEAEDVAQESFARLWQGAADWRPVGAGLPAWLARVAGNLCIDRLRRRREVTTATLPEIEDEAPNAAALIECDELGRRIELCLARLSPRHRAALVLAYYEGYTNLMAADLMDMNLKAFESLLLRARRRMSEELAGAGVVGADLGSLV